MVDVKVEDKMFQIYYWVGFVFLELVMQLIRVTSWVGCMLI